MSREKTDNNYLHNETVAEIAGGFSGNSYWEWFPYIGKFRYCRDFPGMLGYCAGDLPTSFSGWLRIVHPEERRQVASSLKQLIRRKEPVSYECRFKSQSGDWKWIHTRIRSFENGGDAKSIRLMGVNTSIDREKQFEADLDLSKKRLDLLLQCIRQGILLEDHNRKIIYANRFFRKMFGIPDDLNVAGID